MGERNVIKAALLGAGTVGSGVYALAEMLKDEMFQKTGASLEIKKVLVRNTKKDRPGIPKEIMTDNWHRVASMVCRLAKSIDNGIMATSIWRFHSRRAASHLLYNKVDHNWHTKCILPSRTK